MIETSYSFLLSWILSCETQLRNICCCLSFARIYKHGKFLQEKLSENPDFIKTYQIDAHVQFDPVAGFFRVGKRIPWEVELAAVAEYELKGLTPQPQSATIEGDSHEYEMRSLHSGLQEYESAME